MDDFCSRILLLSRMDIEGFRRPRTVSQLSFEVLVQPPLQCRIVSMPHFAAQMGLDNWRVILSMGFDLFHSIVSGCLTWAEARSCRPTLLPYLALCMSGRTIGYPFGAVHADADGGTWRGHRLGFGRGRGAGVRLRCARAPGGVPGQVLGALRVLPTDGPGADRESVPPRPSGAQGAASSGGSRQHVVARGFAGHPFVHRPLANCVRLEMGKDVGWTRVFEDSSLEWETESPDRLQSRGRTTQAFLLEFLAFQDVEEVRALVDHGAELFGVGLAGHILQIEAVCRRAPPCARCCWTRGALWSPTRRSARRRNGVVRRTLSYRPT